MEKQQELIAVIHDTIDRILEINNELYELYIKRMSSKEYIEFLIEFSKHQAPQRTKEWYQMRGGCVTASDIAAILGNDKYKSSKKVLTEKCTVQKPWSNIFTRWGNKYEYVSAQLYEKMNNVKVYDAPLLIHPIYPFVGASCDGFVIDEVNNEGWLIEIKSPYRRIPNGTIPLNYRDQPKTQMAVTKVNRCDWFDCKFEEFMNEQDFIEDTQAEHKGVLFEYYNNLEVDENGFRKEEYLYPPLNLDYKEQKSWILSEFKSLRTKFPDKYSGSKFVYWKLQHYCQVTMYRDTNWFNDNLPRFKEFWNKIVYHRKNGIENLPKKV